MSYKVVSDLFAFEDFALGGSLPKKVVQMPSKIIERVLLGEVTMRVTSPTR
jgi:hypothetical protein